MGKEFYFEGNKYLIDDDNMSFERKGTSYYKFFKIYKDNEFWSSAEIGVTDQVTTTWSIKGEQIEKFLLEISPYIIKIDIYNNKITRNGQKNILLQTSNMKSTPDETLQYYENQAIALDEPRIGFR